VPLSPSYLHDENHDPGELDSSSGEEPQTKEPLLIGLLDWQESMLRCWFNEHHRELNDQEMLGFLVLLHASQADIKAYFKKRLDKGKFTLTAADVLDHGTLDFDFSVDHQISQEFTTEILPPLEIRRQSIEGTEALCDANSYAGPSKRMNSILDGFLANGNIQGDSSAWLAIPQFDTDKFVSGPMTETTLSTFQPRTVSGSNSSSDWLVLPDDQFKALKQTPPPDTTPTESQGTLKATKPLRRLFRNIIRNSIKTGCKQNLHRRAQTGRYACTVGCDYRTTRPQDLERHEQGLYPQHFYLCVVCGDPNTASGPTFTRKDHVLKHIKKFHPGQTTPKECEVAGVRKVFPDRCHLCLHHRHDNWRQRWEHIIWHYQLGHVFPLIIRPHDHNDYQESSSKEDSDSDTDTSQHGSDDVDDQGSGRDGPNAEATRDSEAPTNDGFSNSSEDARGDEKPENQPERDGYRGSDIHPQNLHTGPKTAPSKLMYAQESEIHVDRDTQGPHALAGPAMQTPQTRGNPNPLTKRAPPKRTSLSYLGIPDSHDGLAIYMRWVRMSHYAQGRTGRDVASSNAPSLTTESFSSTASDSNSVARLLLVCERRLTYLKLDTGQEDGWPDSEQQVQALRKDFRDFFCIEVGSQFATSDST
jgi:hypothetical protein